MGTGCGCGCGGDPSRSSPFVRPRFFAGQLLTEDDLGLLIDYTTAKNRLHNRSLYGPGVVCGLEVACDPCGGGAVLVRPGHALDPDGRDIVVPCAERVDVRALVREQRVAALGVDCGDPCEDGAPRRYGLFVRYEENQIEPVTPYATEEPCPSPGCVPSRLQEGFRFSVGPDPGHRRGHDPGARLTAALGDPARADDARRRDRRLGQYADALHAASLAPGRTFRFDASDAKRYADSLALLRADGDTGPPAPAKARATTEQVRALASAVARFDTYDPAGRDRLIGEHPDLARAADARAVLAAACDRLAGTDTEAVWPDPLRRSIARAVVTETRARVVPGEGAPDAPLELRLIAQGAPLSHALRTEFRGDLALIRAWLLGRLDLLPARTDCALPADTARIDTPRPLPAPPPGSTEPVTAVDLRRLAEAVAALTTAVLRFVTDAACSATVPPCSDRTGADILLARVELDDCDVVRVCFAAREQVLPGGWAYGAWLPRLHRVRELAERLCCRPLPEYRPPDIPAEGPVPRPYAEALLDDPTPTGELAELLALLLPTAPEEPRPAAPAEPAGSPAELRLLSARVTELTAALDGLRAQLDGVREQTGPRREQPPERLGPRLERLADAPGGQPGPPARKPRAPRTPKSGETT
ncbi:hypothetical protein [Streptomyces sp. NPDC014894]|uniref:hypothetical protein n=1 Tax=unclassified Streptomyces TaxID=2593676 RepID=UPI0036F9718B